MGICDGATSYDSRAFIGHSYAEAHSLLTRVQSAYSVKGYTFSDTHHDARITVVCK